MNTFCALFIIFAVAISLPTAFLVVDMAAKVYIDEKPMYLHNCEIDIEKKVWRCEEFGQETNDLYMLFCYDTELLDLWKCRLVISRGDFSMEPIPRMTDVQLM